MSETPVLLSLGANIGDTVQTLRNAVAALRTRVFTSLNGVSSLYETEPVGYLEQPVFVNICVAGHTALPSDELREVLLAIERECGRRPRPRWHEREIDIDILLFGNEIITGEKLQVPHPRMHERRFVLVPACEIAAQMIHPVFETTLETLLRRCPDQSSVQRMKSPPSAWESLIIGAT